MRRIFLLMFAALLAVAVAAAPASAIGLKKRRAYGGYGYSAYPYSAVQPRGASFLPQLIQYALPPLINWAMQQPQFPIFQQPPPRQQPAPAPTPAPETVSSSTASRIRSTDGLLQQLVEKTNAIDNDQVNKKLLPDHTSTTPSNGKSLESEKLGKPGNVP
jgi:hypothetical protein